jgi:cell division protein FtsW
VSALLDRQFTGWFGGAKRPASIVLPVRLGASRQTATGSRPVQDMGFDQTLVWVTVALLAWGLVMVYSASISMPENPKLCPVHPHLFPEPPCHLAGAVFCGSAAGFSGAGGNWEKAAPWLFVVSLVLLAFVLLPGIGKKVYGARRWIGLGPLSFQPSELVKFTVLLYAADYMVRKMEVKERFFRAVLPMGAAVAVVGVLLLAEPDMGAFMVIAVIAMGILFLGGVNARMFFLIITVLLVAFSLMIATSEFRRERIFAYLDPWSEKNALAKGYQLTHSLIAIGRGESIWCGTGRQRGKTALVARGAYRLSAGRDR